MRDRDREEGRKILWRRERERWGERVGEREGERVRGEREEVLGGKGR